jgi:diguanylate cyclase (GGDEF)-like protein
VNIGSPNSRFRASQFFGLLAGGFALLFGATVALLSLDQQQVVEATKRLKQETVPQIIRFHRLARTIEQLRHEGTRLFEADSPESRQQALFVATMLARHPNMQDGQQASTLAVETEKFLVKAGQQLSEDPASFKKLQAEWKVIDNLLSLLVNDAGIKGGDIISDGLAGVERSMQNARIKLLTALVMVAAFLLLLVYLLRKYLIDPLQTIDHELSELSMERPVPEFVATPLVEIFSIEEASRRLHASLVDNERARHEMENLAHRDELTGLNNRRFFMVQADAELVRAHRYDRPVTVGMADLDFFKRVNDTHGHAAGDTVLKAFAHLLLDSVRQTDLVCRYGGEEFAFVFPESTLDEVQVLAERFRQRFSEHDIRLPDGNVLRITLSIGLADASRCSLEQALNRADEALYKAKHQGRNRVVLADNSEQAAN